MYRALILLIALLAVLLGGVGAPTDGREVMGPPPPVEPPNLTLIPTANVVGSLDIDLSAAGVFLGEKSTYRGAALLGIGDISEVGLSSIETVSSLREKNEPGSMNAGCIKLAFRGWKHWQGTAAIFRRSGTQRENALTPILFEPVDYEKKVGEFSVVTTLANFSSPEEGASADGGWKGTKIKVHLGLGYVNGNLTYRDSIDVRDSFLRPFGGVEMWRGSSRIPQSRIIAEFGWLPHFKGAYGEERVEDIWAVASGVRFFWHRYGTVDVGVRYQSNYDSLAESTIQVKFRMGWPTHLIRDRIVGS